MFARALIFAVAVWALGSGCAGVQRTRLIEQRAVDYIYAHPAAEVLEAATALLADDEFRVERGADGVLRTRWRASYNAEGVAQTWVRYAVGVYPIGQKHCRVQIMKLTRSTLGMEEYHPTFGGGSEARGGTGANVNSVNHGTGSVALPFAAPVLRRDLEMEWKLIQRLDPARAKQIQSSAEAELARK